MIYRRKTYKIDPEQFERFNRFFHEYFYPNQMKHGATLVGRWVTKEKDEITAIWEYESIEAYQNIECLSGRMKCIGKRKNEGNKWNRCFMKVSKIFSKRPAIMVSEK
jgi:hypothetical protein